MSKKLQSYFYQKNEGRDEWLVRFSDKSVEVYETESAWNARLTEIRQIEAHMAAKQEWASNFQEAIKALLDAQEVLRRQADEYALLGYAANGTDPLTDEDLSDLAKTADQATDAVAVVASLLAYPAPEDRTSLLRFAR